MRFLVIVTADPNDADYIDRSEYVEEDRLPLVRKVADAVKAFKPRKHRRSNWTRDMNIRPDWPDGTEHTVEEKYAGVLTPEEIEEFIDDFLPYSQDEGMHTIYQIQIIKVESIEKLL